MCIADVMADMLTRIEVRSYSNDQLCICNTAPPEKKWTNPYLVQEVIEHTKDVWIKTLDGDLFKAHANCLAKISDIMHVKLLEDKTACISPTEVFTTTPVFRCILAVVYEGCCAIDQLNLASLLEAATEYNIKCLLNLCGQFMLETIGMENSINYYKKALVYLCEHVRAKILHYIRVNFSDLIGHQSTKVKFNKPSNFVHVLKKQLKI